MTDNFAEYPESVTELRADANANAALWAARDVLIGLLREIDAGRLEADLMVVAYRKVTAPGKADSHYWCSTPDMHAGVGLLEVAKWQMLNGD